MIPLSGLKLIEESIVGVFGDRFKRVLPTLPNFSRGMNLNCFILDYDLDPIFKTAFFNERFWDANPP